MALETLLGVKYIGGFAVAVMDDLKKTNPELFPNDTMQMDYKIFERDFRPNFPIQIRHDKNSISFTIQNDPIKENGINGCQVNTIFEAGLKILEGLNDKYPCRENAIAITKFQEGIMWLEERTKDRETRGVEGTNQV
ncbi:MAG: hypothetical protein COA63_014305 [Methylophaga sp.]|nr:hypothetical protein [Methylophaga sp.]